MLSIRLWSTVDQSSVVKFWGRQKLHTDFSTVQEVGTPNPHVV